MRGSPISRSSSGRSPLPQGSMITVALTPDTLIELVGAPIGEVPNVGARRPGAGSAAPRFGRLEGGLRTATAGAGMVAGDAWLRKSDRVRRHFSIGRSASCEGCKRSGAQLAICETRPAPRAETCLHVPAGTTAGQPCDPCCTEAATYRRQSRIASRLLRARSGKDGRHGPERRVGDVCGDHLRRGIPGSSRPNTRARRLRLLLEEDPQVVGECHDERDVPTTTLRSAGPSVGTPRNPTGGPVP